MNMIKDDSLQCIFFGCDVNINFYTYIFMFESCKNFYFPESPLTVSLMLKWWYFFYGNFCFRDCIQCRTVTKNTVHYQVLNKRSLNNKQRINPNPYFYFFGLHSPPFKRYQIFLGAIPAQIYKKIAQNIERFCLANINR